MNTEGSTRHSSWGFEKTVKGRGQGKRDSCRLDVFDSQISALWLGWNDTVGSDASSRKVSLFWSVLSGLLLGRSFGSVN